MDYLMVVLKVLAIWCAVSVVLGLGIGWLIGRNKRLSGDEGEL